MREIFILYDIRWHEKTNEEKNSSFFVSVVSTLMSLKK